MVAVVYIDILVIVNFIINYFLILFTAFFTNEVKKRLRFALAAFVGALFSLTLFLPQLLEFLSVIIKLLGATVMAGAAFGFKGLKRLARNTAYLFVSSYLFAGLIFSLKKLTASRALVINNHNVYIGISPIFLIVTVLVLYLLLTLAEVLFKKPKQLSKTVLATLISEQGSAEFLAMIDSGNKLRDAATGSGVIVLKKRFAKRLIDENALSALNEFESGVCRESTLIKLKRFSLIPFTTVSGSGTLLGFYGNKCVVKADNGNCEMSRPVFAFARDDFINGADGLLSYDSLYME